MHDDVVLVVATDMDSVYVFIRDGYGIAETIVKEIWEIVYNVEDQAQRAYIISDEDYEEVRSM